MAKAVARGMIRAMTRAIIKAMTRAVVFGSVCAVATAVLGAVPDGALEVLRSAGGAPGFSIVGPPYDFRFPRDHGPHPDFRQEWWYLTGNLTSAAGERFGFELTFFRVALAPPPGVSAAVAATTVPDRSPWRARQVYLAHFAITDVARHTFRFAQRYERDALGLAGAQAEPCLRVWLDNWEMGGSPNWTVHAQQGGYELELEVQGLAAPVLNGERGLSVKASDPGAASYYYSIPRVQVRGQLLRDAVPIDVSGVAWLDREWSNSGLGVNEAGWDWFALQLDDGSALMFYSLRHEDGSREAHSAGTWVGSDGQTRALANEDVAIDVGDHWDSPRGGRYPARWRIRVASLALDVDVRPVLANQELGTSPRYWEGAVDFSGTRDASKTSGRGYVELVGYAR